MSLRQLNRSHILLTSVIRHNYYTGWSAARLEYISRTALNNDEAGVVKKEFRPKGPKWRRRASLKSLALPQTKAEADLLATLKTTDASVSNFNFLTRNRLGENHFSDEPDKPGTTKAASLVNDDVASLRSRAFEVILDEQQAGDLLSGKPLFESDIALQKIMKRGSQVAIYGPYSKFTNRSSHNIVMSPIVKKLAIETYKKTISALGTQGLCENHIEIALSKIRRVHAPHALETTKVSFKRKVTPAHNQQPYTFSENDGIFPPLLCELAMAAGIGPTNLLRELQEGYLQGEAAPIRWKVSKNSRRHRSPIVTTKVSNPTTAQMASNMQLLQFVSERVPHGSVSAVEHSDEVDTHNKRYKMVPKLVLAKQVSPEGSTVKKIVSLVRVKTPINVADSPSPLHRAKLSFPQEKSIFEAQYVEAEASYRRHVTENAKLLSPALIKELISADGFKPADFSMTPEGYRNSISETSARYQYFTLPYDMHMSTMREMLQKLHELPEIQSLMKDLGIGHLDVRRHLFRDAAANSFIINAQRIRLDQQQTFENAETKSVAAEKNSIETCRSQVASELRSINKQQLDLEGRIEKHFLNEVEVGLSLRGKVTKLVRHHEFLRDKYRLFKEQQQILDNHSDSRLMSKRASFYILNRNHKDIPLSFDLETDDKIKFQERLKKEECAFVAELICLLSKNIRGFEMHAPDKLFPKTKRVKFGTTGTFDRIISEHAPLADLIDHLQGYYEKSVVQDAKETELENLKCLVTGQAIDALVATMAFPPIELMADLKIVKSWNEINLRRWCAMGRKAAEQHNPGELNSGGDINLLTAPEQREWRRQCFQRLLDVTSINPSTFCPMSRWVMKLTPLGAATHGPTIVQNVEDRMQCSIENNHYLVRLLWRAVAEATNIPDLCANLRRQQPYRFDQLATTIERAQEYTSRSEVEDGHIEPEAFLSTIKNAFVGLSPEQLQLFHNFEAITDELFHEVKMTAALRLVIFDVYPEFTLFYSPTEVLSLKDVACEEYLRGGILSCQSSPSLIQHRIRQKKPFLRSIHSYIKNKFSFDDITPRPQWLYSSLQRSEHWRKSVDSVPYFSRINGSKLCSSQITKRRRTRQLRSHREITLTEKSNSSLPVPTTLQKIDTDVNLVNKYESLTPEQQSVFQFFFPLRGRKTKIKNKSKRVKEVFEKLQVTHFPLVK